MGAIALALASCGNKGTQSQEMTDSIAADTVAVVTETKNTPADTVAAPEKTPEEIEAENKVKEERAHVDVLLDKFEGVIDQYIHYREKAKSDESQAATYIEKSIHTLSELQPIVTSLAEVKDNMTDAQRARTEALTAKLEKASK